MITARGFLPLVALALGACANAPQAEAPSRAPAAAPVAAPLSLTGTRWIGVVEGSPDPRSLPRLEFVTSERVAGYTGCNMMSGGWRMEGGAVRVGPLVSTKRAPGLAPLAIPLALVAIHFAAASLSGASVNPARSIGSALLGGDLNGLWIYILAPIIGAIGGWALFRVLDEDVVDEVVAE